MLIHVPNLDVLGVIMRSNSIKSFIELPNMKLRSFLDASGVNWLPNQTCDTWVSLYEVRNPLLP